MWSDPDDIENWVVSPRRAAPLFSRMFVVQPYRLAWSHRARARRLVLGEALATVWTAPHYCYRFGNTGMRAIRSGERSA